MVLVAIEFEVYMKLRRDLTVEFDPASLTNMVINAMAAMMQEFLGTGDQDLVVREAGTMTSPDWEAPRSIEGGYVDFVYTGDIRMAIISVSPEAVEDRDDYSRRSRYFVLVDINNEDRRVVAVYEEIPDTALLEFNQETLNFVVPPRN